MQRPFNSCYTCQLKNICFPFGLNHEELKQLDDLLINESHILKPNVILFKENSVFNSLYLVRYGCIKTSRKLRTRIEKTTGFFIPGEMLGLESIYTKFYQQPIASFYYANL